MLLRFTSCLALLSYVAQASAQDASSEYIWWCNKQSSQLCPATGQFLADLSCGWCRSWQFASNIAGNTLRAVGLDGGALPGDGNNTHVYMVSVSLDSPFDLVNLNAWKLQIIPSLVWNTKGGTLWSDRSSSSLFRYGGHTLGTPTGDTNEIPRFDIASSSWTITNSSDFSIPLFTSGASVDIPELDLAFYIGGWESSDTSTDFSAQDDNMHFQTSIVQFNSSSLQGSQIDAPFLPVQFGAATYLPAGFDATDSSRKGVVIFFGGDSPPQSVVPKADLQLTANSWDFVWILDLASQKWFKQPTTGKTQARTEFCSVTMYDDATQTWQIWVMGGADLETHTILSSVSVLSIPSFRWFEAADVPASTPPRMTLDCVRYGSQIFGIGGRTDNSDWGGQDFDSIAYLYDTSQQTTVTAFDPLASVYTAPETIRDAILSSKYPATWVDEALSKLFETSLTSTLSVTATGTSIQLATSVSSALSKLFETSLTSTLSVTATGTSIQLAASVSSAPHQGGSPRTSSAIIAVIIIVAVLGLFFIIGMIVFVIKRASSSQLHISSPKMEIVKHMDYPSDDARRVELDADRERSELSAREDVTMKLQTA